MNFQFRESKNTNLERTTVHTLASFSCTCGVTTLGYETFDNPVKYCVVVVTLHA